MNKIAFRAFIYLHRQNQEQSSQTDSHPSLSPFDKNLKLLLVNRKVMLYGL